LLNLCHEIAALRHRLRRNRAEPPPVSATSIAAESQSDSPEPPTMRETRADTGFAPPAERPLGHERRSVALAALIATIGLTLGTIVAATVVTAAMAQG
jgi:hypothetical protein